MPVTRRQSAIMDAQLLQIMQKIIAHQNKMPAEMTINKSPTRPIEGRNKNWNERNENRTRNEDIIQNREGRD